MINRVKPDSWSLNDKLTSSQANALDMNTTYALDKRSGQTDTLSSVVSVDVTGGISLNGGYMEVINGSNIALGNNGIIDLFGGSQLTVYNGAVLLSNGQVTFGNNSTTTHSSGSSESYASGSTISLGATISGTHTYNGSNTTYNNNASITMNGTFNCNGTATFQDINVSSGNRYKVSTRTTTRSLPLNFAQTTWGDPGANNSAQIYYAQDPWEPGILTKNASSGGSYYFPIHLKLPHGCILNDIRVPLVTVARDSSLTISGGYLGLYRVSVSSGAAQTLGAINMFGIPPGMGSFDHLQQTMSFNNGGPLNHVINNEQYMYILVVRGYYNSSLTVYTRIPHGILYEIALTQLDEFAA